MGSFKLLFLLKGEEHDTLKIMYDFVAIWDFWSGLEIFLIFFYNLFVIFAILTAILRLFATFMIFFYDLAGGRVLTSQHVSYLYP